MKDYVGKDILPGSTLVYPIRRGSTMLLRSAIVISADGDRIHASTTAKRGGQEYTVEISLLHPTRAVVVG